MKCEFCHKEHNGEFATGRFCNRGCANGFSTKDKRKEINKKVSDKLTGRIGHNKGIPSEKKNKTYEEMYGKEKAIILRNKCSNNGWKGTHQTKESNLKRRLTKQKYIIEFGGPKLGKHEKQILDELELSIGYKIIRQYPIIGFFVDGYITKLNICIEIDERSHIKKKEKDKIRQRKIENKLNCKFIRIKD